MDSVDVTEAYLQAQNGILRLKKAVIMLLRGAYPEWLKNSEIGKCLGIYMGHIGHEGHIPRTILEILKAEGIAHQDEISKEWFFSPPDKLVRC